MLFQYFVKLWYICSGKVKLPKNFESCTSKEDLWTKVRRGARPEYLPFFDPKMWTLMQVRFFIYGALNIKQGRYVRVGLPRAHGVARKQAN